MEAGGNHAADSPHAQAARRQRRHSLEHENSHAQWRPGRDARTRPLCPTGADSGFALAEQRPTGHTETHSQKEWRRFPFESLVDTGIERTTLALGPANPF